MSLRCEIGLGSVLRLVLGVSLTLGVCIGVSWCVIGVSWVCFWLETQKKCFAEN